MIYDYGCYNKQTSFYPQLELDIEDWIMQIAFLVPEGWRAQLRPSWTEHTPTSFYIALLPPEDDPEIVLSAQTAWRLILSPAWRVYYQYCMLSENAS